MKSKLLLILPFILGVTACSSTIEPDVDYKQDYAFENIKSFHVLSDEERIMDEVYQISDIDNSRIANALKTTMMNKGLKDKPYDEADILVSYQIVTKDKTKITTYGTSVGYRCFRCRGYRGGAGFGTQVDARTYTEGTVIIDMLDPQTNKSVWRSIVSQPVKKNLSVEEKDQKIREGVEVMLENFLVVPVQ